MQFNGPRFAVLSGVKILLSLILILMVGVSARAAIKCTETHTQLPLTNARPAKATSLSLAVKDLDTYRTWQRRSKEFSDLSFKTGEVEPLQKIQQALQEEFDLNPEAPAFIRKIHKELLAQAKILIESEAPYLETLRFHQRATIILSSYDSRHPKNATYDEPDVYPTEKALMKSLDWEDSEMIKRAHLFAKTGAFIQILSNKTGYAERRFNAGHHIPLYKIEYAFSVRKGDLNEMQSPKKFSSHDWYHTLREHLEQAPGSRVFAVQHSEKIESLLNSIDNLNDPSLESSIHRALFEISHEMNEDVRKFKTIARSIAERRYLFDDKITLTPQERAGYTWLAAHYPDFK